MIVTKGLSASIANRQATESTLKNGNNFWKKLWIYKIFIPSTGIPFCCVKHPMNSTAFHWFLPHICLVFLKSVLIMCIISESHVMHYSGRRFQAKVTRPRGSPAEPPPHLLVCLSALHSRHKPATVSVVPVVSVSAIWKIWHSGWSVSSGRLYVVAKAKALSPCLISVFLCAAKRPPLCFDWSPPLVWGNFECF